MHHWRTLALVSALLGVVLASCAQETTPGVLLQRSELTGPSSSSVDASAGPVFGSGLGSKACTQAQAEPLPQRLIAESAQAAQASEVVLVDDLAAMFEETGSCGGCHTGSLTNGGFNISSTQEFKTKMLDPSWGPALAHITSEGGPNDLSPMPPFTSPNGKPYSQRACGDPVRRFAELVNQWLSQGHGSSIVPDPAYVCDAPTTASASNADAGSASSYAFTPHSGDANTNLGWCIPGSGLVGTEVSLSAQLDAKFAAMMPNSTSSDPGEQIGLPANLSDTDLFTLDPAQLAPYGVIAYAPTYPLWSDNAGKLRFIRVPRGTSIRFDKATQSFAIPPNTRFYKTFLKQVVDDDGSYRWRKMETRLIVSRPDAVDSNGVHHSTALFGTYQWNDTESVATLITTPLRNQKPFADTMFLYDIDQPLAADLLRNEPLDPEGTLLDNHASRHYAIPGSQRCIECHMGSESSSFVLGFMPIQIARVPTGQSGVIEPAGPDELTQLQRFIDYGLVTGVSSASDILPLEQTQLPRTPRNEQELIAQGYMLGNCAHCHNPNGYPTVTNAPLLNDFSLLPTPEGGIFQFSLEKTSPRIFRGPAATTKIPYITPSLMDQPTLELGAAQAPDTSLGFVFAPWRSLIYRNVDNAFPYAYDGAIFPHMPFNTAGYDPRAKQIMADWMVSIPAIRKHPEKSEYAYWGDGAHNFSDNPGEVDTTLQPYAEVRRGDPAYAQAVASAQQRLAILHSGLNAQAVLDTQNASQPLVYNRYADPDVTDDIVDPEVLRDPVCHPVPVGNGSLGYQYARHPHWVNTDTTEAPPPYTPRRPDWANTLVGFQPPVEIAACSGDPGAAAANLDQEIAVGLLQSTGLDTVHPFADPTDSANQIPFGLWDTSNHPECASKLASQSHVSDYGPGGSLASQRPAWIDAAHPPDNAAVYKETPGQVVFKRICFNCHGPSADGHGRIADNLATMTGGTARVADFHDGLFGPADQPGANMQRVFGADLGQYAADAGAIPFGDAGLFGDAAAGASAWADVAAQDRAARYMAWMALGGTLVKIPSDILNIVGETKVLDQPSSVSASSANMLSVAVTLCQSTLGLFGDATADNAFDPVHGGYMAPQTTGVPHKLKQNSSLLSDNGDAQFWLKLCTLNNQPPVHVLSYANSGLLTLRSRINLSTYAFDIESERADIQGANYPPNRPVGNETGRVDSSLQSSNLWPWCVFDDGKDDLHTTAQQQGWPLCPDESANPNWWMSNLEGTTWAVRGAINAGFSVFTYLQWLETQPSPPPDYNQCNLLP